MQLPSHLRQSRHGVWSYRLVLPEVLAAAVGQKEIRKSLGTRCPITAKCLAYALSGKIIPIVRKVKRTMTIDPNSIDPKAIRELIVKGLEIDRSTGSLKAEYIETSNDPEIAKRKFQALWAMTQSAPPAQANPGTARQPSSVRHALHHRRSRQSVSGAQRRLGGRYQRWIKFRVTVEEFAEAVQQVMDDPMAQGTPDEINAIIQKNRNGKQSQRKRSGLVL